MKTMHEMNEVRLFQADPYFLLLFFLCKKAMGVTFYELRRRAFLPERPKQEILEASQVDRVFQRRFWRIGYV